MDRAVYLRIARHYERCLERHGATPKGMDWPNEEDLKRRFKVMLGVVKDTHRWPVSIIDLGCGAGFLVDYLKENGLDKDFRYKGIDISQAMINSARMRHPDHEFEVRDILEDPLPAGCADYVLMNGLLTEKVDLTHEEMMEFSCLMIKGAYNSCRCGIAFNVMSTHVDWMREDLFHWAIDDVMGFLVRECSRNIVIRMDYGLYEYTVYVYR